MARFLHGLAMTLASLIIVILVIHSHILLAVGDLIDQSAQNWCFCHSDRAKIVAVYMFREIIGLWTTPGMIVYFLNRGLYTEIQSWQVAYIVWGFAVGLFMLVELLWVRLYHNSNQEKRIEFWKRLLQPFGLQISTGVGKFFVPLVSVAPAIMGGYFANFVLEETFTLECDERYNPISTMCQDGVCCITLSNHDNWMHFIPELGGAVATAWGVAFALVKYVASFVVNQLITERVEDDDGTTLELTNSINLEDESQAINVKDAKGAESALTESAHIVKMHTF